MRISDWSSDVCSSDLDAAAVKAAAAPENIASPELQGRRARHDQCPVLSCTAQQLGRLRFGASRDQAIGEYIGANPGKSDPRGARPVRRAAALSPQRQPDRRSQRDPYPQVDDEQRVAIEPAMAERLEQPDAVIVEPVQRGLAEATDIGEREPPHLVQGTASRGPSAAPGLP